MNEACSSLLNHPAVSRCYLVDANGVQIDDTMVSDATARGLDPRFRPLESTTSADWYRQQYLRQAIAQPGHVHITAPYLCITGAYMCVTLSLGYYPETTEITPTVTSPINRFIGRPTFTKSINRYPPGPNTIILVW